MARGALVAAGEVGIHGQDVSVILRPSLAAMSSLGDPRDIVQIAQCVLGAPSRWQDADALSVLWACAPDDVDPSILGELDAADGFSYVPGLVEHCALVPIARQLLMHGLIGDVPKAPRPSGEGRPEDEGWSATEIAAVAIAHLRMSDREVWDATMTTLVSALVAKFPQVAEASEAAPSLADHEATMEWFESIRGKRD